MIWNMLEKILHFCIYKIAKINMPEKTWQNVLQFVKFGFVGALNSIIFYGIYVFLVALNINYFVANIIGFSASVVNSYYWNSKYVFVQTEKRNGWITFIKTYISYAMTGIVLNGFLLFVWVELWNVSEYIAPILNLMITIPLNFIINKLWAYRK